MIMIIVNMTHTSFGAVASGLGASDSGRGAPRVRRDSAELYGPAPQGAREPKLVYIVNIIIINVMCLLLIIIII